MTLSPSIANILATNPDLLQQVKAEACRRSLARFVREGWSTVDSEPLRWNWHMDAICDHLQWVLEDWIAVQRNPAHVQRARNILFTVPPGAGKSRLVSVMAPAWMWTRWPAWSVLCLSVNPQVALRDARLSRDVIESPWYQTWFKPTWRLKDDQDAAGDFANTARGSRQSKGMTARVVGQRNSCVVGETMVATEIGDVAIRDLVAMVPVPRVWSASPTGDIELRRVLAWQKTTDRKTIDVVAQSGHTLRCTDDHRIYADGTYQEAARIAGCRVSVLRWPDGAVPGQAESMRELHDGDAYVRDVRQVVPEGRLRMGEAPTPGLCPRPVLLSHMHSAGAQPAGDMAGLQGVQQAVSSAHARPVSAVMLAGLLCEDLAQAPGRQTLSSLRHHDGYQQRPAEVLHDGVQERRARVADERRGKLALQGDAWPRGFVYADAAVHRGAGRASVRGVPEGTDGSRAARPPHRREPGSQPPAQPDLAVQGVSQLAPQVGNSAVASVTRTTVAGRDATHDVYDIQVEGNHNFFAGGLLVHNCILIDDPNDMREVHNASHRDDVNGRWDDSISNRLNNPGTGVRIGMMQRGHEQDWAGHVLGRGGWEHVNIPMEYEPDQARTSVYGWHDPRTVAGETMHPARFTPDVIAVEKALGSYRWAAQYQQRPAPAGGGMLKPEWFGRYDDPPRDADGALDLTMVTLSIDANFKKTENGSRAALLVIGKRGPQRFVIDNVTRSMDYVELKEAIRAIRQKWPDISRILIEEAANGHALLAEMRGEWSDVIAVKTGGDSKEARAMAVQSIIESGSVFIPRHAAWVDAFAHEIGTFPKGSHDDQVDALTQGLNDLRGDGDLWAT